MPKLPPATKPCLRSTNILFAACALILCPGMLYAEEELRERRHEQLAFLLGTWNTEHRLPAGDGEAVTVKGQAEFRWSTGQSWLQHEFQAHFPGRGPVHITTMMNYSPSKEMYNLYLFDHFGGEAGVFYGDWNKDQGIVLSASFVEEDGSTTYQKITLEPVSSEEIWWTQAFSDDGKVYHFAAKGVYSRQSN